MGGYNTAGTMVEIVKVGHEIIINLHDYMSNKWVWQLTRSPPNTMYLHRHLSVV